MPFRPWAGSGGPPVSGPGFLVGFFEAKAIHRELLAQRSTLRAEEIEQRRTLLTYLNAFLRHEVLNTANVIEGYADILVELEEEGTREREYATIVHRQAGDLTEITNAVRLLLETIDAETNLEPRDLVAVLQAELDELRSRDERVVVETAMPDDAYVRGDHLLSRLFKSLLSAMVERRNASVLHVSIRITTTEEKVAVHVRDDGPEIPEAERETLFEPVLGSAEHDLSFLIVDRLAERYGGTVELAESDGDGNEFTVVLPRAGSGAVP
ncbi:MAG: sensor histidine kinase [Haloplanus sp.]